ncbi:MAG: hypothetical protein JSW65_04025 [Candidatus Bipolaricaulota bacterium]|nr:MAG: hypothetical protein JSW65_04025 [Candidatus Bipolaricaulota bacterium]
MKKTRKILPLLALLAIAIAAPLVAIGAADSVEDQSGTETVNLPLLVLVNRLELTDEQISTIHGLLSGILDERESAKSALESLQAAFEEEMIAFDGSAEELDERLDAHRAEIEALFSEPAESHEAVLDGLRETLTYEQGKLLESALPMLFAQRGAGLEGTGTGMLRGARGAVGCGAMPTFGDSRRAGRFRGGPQSEGRETPWGGMRELRRVRPTMHSGAGADLLGDLVEILELKML